MSSTSAIPTESYQTSGPATTTSTSSRDRRSQPRFSKRRPFRPRELQDAGLTPSKARGQHFLTDRTLIARIAAACELEPADTAIEVGSGLGGLTEALAAAAERVIALEIDTALCSYLRQRFASQPRVTVHEQDALLADPAVLLEPVNRGYILAGNLPYNSGLAILRHFLESKFPPRRAIVMLQKEVVDGIVAGPGAMTLAGIGVQVFAAPRRLFEVAPAAFYPPPKVRSAVLRLDVRAAPLVPQSEQTGFFRLVRAGFSAPRKQLRNSLAQGLAMGPEAIERLLLAAAVDGTLRPAGLAIDAWRRLSREAQLP